MNNATNYIIVDGNWAAWGNWTNCTEECADPLLTPNGGVWNRTRTCSNMMPQFGGANCSSNYTGNYTMLMDLPLTAFNGTLVQEQLMEDACNTQPCPSK